MSMLPDEILFAIFNEPSLDLNKLLELRLVSKRFNNLILCLKITRLAVRSTWHSDYSLCLRPSENYSSQLFRFVNEPIGSSITFTNLRNHFLKCRTFQLISSRLKQLSIDKLDFTDGSINKNFLTPLKKLRELRSLQIFWLKAGNRGVKTISLPSVRLLSIVKFESRGSKLRIDAPELSKLAFLNFLRTNGISSPLKLIHPQTLEEIEINYYQDLLAECSNLKTIRFKDASFVNESDVEVILTGFPKLESIYFEFFKDDFEDFGASRPLQLIRSRSLKEKMGEIIRLRRKHRKSNIKIYLMDFKIKNQSNIDALYDSYQELDVEKTRMVLNNYRKLASVTTAVSAINYAELVDHFGSAIPDKFHQQFVNVRVVRLNQKQGKNALNQKRFVEFIEKCQVLNVLEIKNTDLDASFYSGLRMSCPYLAILRMELKKQVEQPDMSFVLSLVHLAELSINRPLQGELVTRAFAELKSFAIIRCEMKGKPIEIKRAGDRTVFKILNKDLNSFLRADFLEALRNFLSLVGPV